MPEVQNTGLIQSARMREQEQEEAHEKKAMDIIQKMEGARKTIETEVMKLAELSSSLRSHALRRRNTLTPGYLSFSSAYTRICGAMHTGLRRTASIGRALDTAKQAQEEVQRQEDREEEQRRMRAQHREIEQLSLPQGDDFDLVYGDEVSDAG